MNIKVYDILGNEVTELVNEYLLSGNHQFRWNADDMSTGDYFVKMRTKNFTKTQKVFLIK